MKCKYCGQEMIDIKDYCVNCGRKLKKEEKGISVGGLFLIFGILVAVGLLVCYMIMNYNTEKDIEPYIDHQQVEESKVE